MNTPTPPPDLLAPLLALVAKWHEQGAFMNARAIQERASAALNTAAALDAHASYIKSCARELQAAIESLAAHRGTKAQAFKDYVHHRLDAMGVPHSVPESEHDKAGCRVGGRLDFVEARLAAHRGEVAPVARAYRPRNGDPVIVDAIDDFFLEPSRRAFLYRHPPQEVLKDALLPQAQAGAGDANVYAYLIAMLALEHRNAPLYPRVGDWVVELTSLRENAGKAKHWLYAIGELVSIDDEAEHNYTIRLPNGQLQKWENALMKWIHGPGLTAALEASQ